MRCDRRRVERLDELSIDWCKTQRDISGDRVDVLQNAACHNTRHQRRKNPEMSKTNTSPKIQRLRPIPPLVSATDVDPANWPRAHFDEDIAFAIKDTARRRAPTREARPIELI